MSYSAVDITKRLIQFPSVTPLDEGALDYLQDLLVGLGFQSQIFTLDDDGSGPIKNLYAKYGNGSPHFCFAGHTDVVPTGPEDHWTYPPFAAEEKDGVIYGRGAVDMKGAIACFVDAVKKFLDQNDTFNGTISFLITGDEEARATNGTKALLKKVCDEMGEKIDFCLVGEPTNPNKIGEMMKVGRRGSLSGKLEMTGTQGHVAYPHLANNPCHAAVSILNYLKTLRLDEGTEFFQPSSLQITSIDVGNTATNIIPEATSIAFNIRYNDLHNADALKAMLKQKLEELAKEENCQISVSLHSSGESFRTDINPTIEMISDIVFKHTGIRPEYSTSGGTSDARFITNYSQVVEFGLIGKTLHKIDECSNVEDICLLSNIYNDILNQFFK